MSSDNTLRIVVEDDSSGGNSPSPSGEQFDAQKALDKQRELARRKAEVDRLEYEQFGDDSTLGRKKKLEREKLDKKMEQAWDRTLARQKSEKEMNHQSGLAAISGMGGMGGDAAKLLGAAGKLGGGIEGTAALGKAMSGPVGAALAVAEVVADKATQFFNEATRSAKFFGDSMAGLARNELPDVRGRMADVASGFADSIPVLGGVIKSQIQFAKQMTDIPGQVKNAFLARGNELSGLSGSIAYAKARSDIASFRGDLKEAQTLGPEYARLIDADSRLQAEIRELLLPIKRAVLQWIVPQVEGAANILGQIRVRIEQMERAGQRLGENFTMLVDAISKVPVVGKAIADEIKKAREQPKENEADLLNGFYAGLDRSLRN
jgi:hypothetical protein